MKTIFLLALFAFISIDLFSQSVRDVRYNQINLIDSNFIGQEVKIDFKSKWLRNELQKNRIPDTVAINLDNRQVSLIEVKGMTADSWLFDREYLKSYDYNRKNVLQIKDLMVIDASEDSIKFRMTLLLMNDDTDKSRLMSSTTKDIWISRATIDGLLTRRRN